MNISVKKFSKKSLSLLIALIMVFSALPLTPPISADAATTTTTLNKDSFGMLTNGNDSRFKNKKFNIVNDQGPNNTSAGLLHYDLSPFADTNISTVTFNVTIDSFLDEPNIDYVNFYYSTTINNASTYLSKDGVENANLGWGNGAGNKAVTDYSSNLGFNANQILYLQKFETSKSNVTGSKDVTSIFKNIILSGAKDLYIVIMHNTAGDANNKNHWSDTTITPANINFTVTYSNYDFSNPTQAKDYIDSRINGFVMPLSKAVTCNGTDLNLSNVLYTSNIYLDNSLTEFSLNQNKKDTKMSARLMSPSNRIVYMYTGNKSIVKVPLFFEAQKNSSVLQRYKVNYVCSASSNWTIDNENWIRTTAYNKWDTNSAGTRDGEYKVSSSSTHNAPDFNANNRPEGVDGTTDFRNLVTYNGTLTFSNNYFQISELPKVDMSFDGFCYWYDWGAQYSYQNNITKNTTGLGIALSTISLANTASYSVIDFSGYNALVSNNTMKNKYNDVKTHETEYTEDSVSAYYKAVANLVKFKTSNYDLSTDNGVSSCARDLATVVNDYNTANNRLTQKKATVTFTRTNYDDPQLSAETIKTVEVEPGNSIPDIQFPDLSDAEYINNNEHYEYFWQIEENFDPIGELTSSTKVYKDITVREVKKTVNCSIVNKGIKDDTVNLECSVCKHASTLNASAYKAAVLDARASIANSQAYSQASRDALSSVLSVQETAINEAKTQQEVDNCTSAILSANQLQTDNNPAGKLVYNQYSITLNYVDEKGAGLGTQEITNVNYGTIKEVTAETNFKDKSYVVYKWTRLDKNGDVLSGLNSTSVSVNVVGNLTYFVHLKSTQAEYPDNTAVVTLNNKAGKPVDVGYVTTNEPQNVVVNGNTNEIGETTTLTAPQYSFYSVKGFMVNGELITAKSGTKSITVTKDMTIIPLYQPESYVDITRGDGEIFTINGKEIKSYSARWDELITLEATGDVIWYTTTKKGSEVVLGQGATFKFRANENIEIYTKQVGDSLTPNSRVGYFGYDADLKKVTIVNNFFVPDGANENVKAGVVVSTKAKTKEEMIKQYNAGSLKFEGGYDKFTADKNQIRITINRNGTGTSDFSMWALSYVIVDGKEYFADDVISYTYNSQSTTA